MSTYRLLLRSLLYYWRTNLAILLGVVTATAVIGGALVVGDSVRGSLREMSLERLGQIDYALSGSRYFTEDLADELAAHVPAELVIEQIAPAIIIPGSAQFTPDDSENVRLAGQATVFGLDERGWELTRHGDLAAPTDSEIVINRRVADQLNVEVGEDVSVVVEIPSSIPRDSLLGEREETAAELYGTVSSIVEEELGVSRLSLNPAQQVPLNIYVPLQTLQELMGLQYVPRSRRNPIEQQARVNTLLIAGGRKDHSDSANATVIAERLTETAHELKTLADLGLRIAVQEDRDYLSLESSQMILETGVVEAAEATAEELNLAVSPVLVYLLNRIEHAEDAERYSKYSIIAGLDFPLPEPFGPFPFDDDRPDFPLDDDQVLLNSWLAEDLDATAGDDIQIAFYTVGSHGELPEERRTLRVAGIVELGPDSPADDRGLTPTVPGITDVESFDEWDQPFEMDLPVTDRDDTYWEERRATPKLFMQLDAAQQLWSSRYGQLTSFRVASSDVPAEELAARFEQELLAQLHPDVTGLVVQSIKEQHLQAAAGTTDFTGLFLGFSFFLIAAAAILIGLLFRLAIERRVSQMGLLAAVGLSPRQVRNLLFVEAGVLVLIGGLLGLAAAVGYAAVMVYGLKTWWFGAIGTRFLEVYVEPLSLVYGLCGAIFVAGIAIWWAVRQTKQVSTRSLLAGSMHSTTASGRARLARWSSGIALVLILLLSAGVAAGLISTSEAFSGISWRAAAFFVIGAAALVLSLSLLSVWLNSDRAAAVRGAGTTAIVRLGVRNAARNRTRSVLTAGLIASATFVIVAVAAAKRNPIEEAPRKDSGNGGFTLVAETATPILYDLNSSTGLAKLQIAAAAEERLESANVMPFRVRPGENASCLNLYRTQLPTILGVTDRMIEQGGFKFADTPGDNPWTLLEGMLDNGHVPVMGDMNTLLYSLHKGIGDTVDIPEGQGREAPLEIVGMLDGSVFQGVLLMSEENFNRLFPQHAGYGYFLIDTPVDSMDEVTTLLETELADYGFDAEPVAQRLANFLAVQNTYLSTFQALGGLGLLLGTLGLAAVMLRNVLERRSELALMRAVGFQKTRLATLVLWENACLLLWGLAGGTASALIAMTPHLLSTGADVPWLDGGLLLLAVFVAGMAAAILAVYEALRTPILSTLRTE